MYGMWIPGDMLSHILTFSVDRITQLDLGRRKSCNTCIRIVLRARNTAVHIVPVDPVDLAICTSTRSSSRHEYYSWTDTCSSRY